MTNLSPSDQPQHVIIKARGSVQGVNFRERTRRLTYALDILGEVWNDPDDEELVVIEAVGSKKDIDVLVSKIETWKIDIFKDEGSKLLGQTSYIHIRSLDIERENISDISKYKFKGFRIRPVEGLSPGERELTRKLNFAGQIMGDFQNAHNRNFDHLDYKFGQINTSITEGINDLKGELQELKGLKDELGEITKVARKVAQHLE